MYKEKPTEDRFQKLFILDLLSTLKLEVLWEIEEQKISTINEVIPREELKVLESYIKIMQEQGALE